MSPPSRPDSRSLILLDRAKWKHYKKNHLLSDSTVRWDKLSSIPAPEKVRTLRLLVDSKEVDTLPHEIELLTNLESLELPEQFVANLTADSLPRSITELTVTGHRSTKWPKGLTLDHITYLSVTGGYLRFTYDQLPGLRRLNIQLDRRGWGMLKTVLCYEQFTELSCRSPAKPAEFFESIAVLPLQVLGLFGTSIDSLRGIEKLQQLKELYIAGHPRLTKLDPPLRELSSIECLRIAYCKHIEDIEAVLDLPSLKTFEIVGCDNIGLESIRSQLEQRKLDLSIVATS